MFHLLKSRTSIDIFITGKCKVTFGLKYSIKLKKQWFNILNDDDQIMLCFITSHAVTCINTLQPTYNAIVGVHIIGCVLSETMF